MLTIIYYRFPLTVLGKYGKIRLFQKPGFGTNFSTLNDHGLKKQNAKNRRSALPGGI
jgi:hypothetical protein